MQPLVMRVQNIYGDFLRSFKVFLDKVTRHSLNKIEWNYGSKPLEYYYMMNGHESFEYPVAIIEIQDIQQVDIGHIVRNRAMHPNYSVHNESLCYNFTKHDGVIIDKRWVNMLFNVTINTEDVTSMLNLHDLALGSMPQNFMFFDYKYWTYIEVTDCVGHWDFDNDNIDNVYIRDDATFRYQPKKHYKETNEDFFESHERDRVKGRDEYPGLEGRRYFAMLESEPILKITSITKQTDKESQQHSLIMSFEAQIEIPNLLICKNNPQVESIEIVIDTANPNGIAHNNPILIDMESMELTNKNISKGILISPDSFKFPRFFTPPRPTTQPYLEVNQYIDLNIHKVALWAVENVTEASSSRFFIPLEHATVEYIKDEHDFIVSTRFTFKEMNWFEDFDFQNQFNYLKVILFQRDP